MPLGNESGVSERRHLHDADKLVAAVDQSTASRPPVNRTIQVMRARGISGVRTPERLAPSWHRSRRRVIVGNVTAYDLYDPPTLGLALALYCARTLDRLGPDPMRLQQAYRDDRVSVRSNFESRPAATVSETLTPSRTTPTQVKNYARAGTTAPSASGWRGILASMDRYTEFAAYVAVSRLIDQGASAWGSRPREGGRERRFLPSAAQR